MATTSFGFDIADALDLGMVIGPPSAKVTIVEAFDFACPHCGTFDPILSQLVHEYGGRVRVVFKPYVLRPESRELHLFGCAAGIQRKFAAFKTALFKSREVVILDFSDPGSRPVVDPSVASSVGLDADRLVADAQSQRCQDVVERSHKELEKRGIDFLPRHFVNGEPVEAGNKGELKSAIDALLAH